MGLSGTSSTKKPIDANIQMDIPLTPMIETIFWGTYSFKDPLNFIYEFYVTYGTFFIRYS